jgi:hypothetical protein
MRGVLDIYDPFDGMNFHAQNKYVGWMCDAFHWMKVKFDFPKRIVGMFFWTHLTAWTPHPPTHRPTSHLPTLACSFCHLPSHLHISNNQVSSPPTCPSIYLPSGIHIPTYLPIYPYTPTKVLHTTQAQGNVDETRCKYCNPCGTIKWWNPMKVLHFL